MTELAELSLTELVTALRVGRATDRDALAACLARVREWQPRLNAFVRADERGRHGRGPLAGVPLAHKDMYYRAGRVATCGARIRRDWVAETTAAALERLDAAGAVDLGTLHMTEFAYGPTGHNEHLGACRNPWNTDHITGGSSSGAGAAVAARLAYGALGSDTGGSIRLPASCCGVTGLKPTWGRVSRHGAMPLAYSLDTVGPLARTAADCAALLQAIAGADARDPQTAARPVPDYVAELAQGARGLRVGYAPRLLEESHPEVADAVRAALDALRGAGVAVIEVPAPDVDALSAHCMTLMQVEASSVHGAWMRERPHDYAAQTRARLEAGYAIPATVYVDSLRFRAVALERFAGTQLAGVHALALPTVPVRVPTLAETGVGGGPDMARTLGELTRFTRWVNYLGVPAVSLPAGFDARGLPIGLQLVARPFEESILCRLGDTFQQTTDWHRRVPA